MRCRVLLILFAGWLVLVVGTPAAAEPDPDEQVVAEAKVATDGPALLQFLRQRTLSEADRQKISALIQQLGDDEFAIREKASADLVALGPLAVPLLRQSVGHPDIEVARRAEGCLDVLDKQYKLPGSAVSAAVARLLGKRKPAGAAETLLAYLPFADDDSVIEDIRLALTALALENGKPSPALLHALKDPAPLKRGAAAEALIRATAADPLPEARKLIADADGTVRLRVALALAEGKFKEAIPILIGLLAELPQAQGWQAEELLYRLAGEQAPNTTLGSEPAARQKARDAWLAWWKENEATADLGRLTGTDRLLGYTLIVSTDNQGGGQVMELGPDKKTRWTVPGLQFVIDAQVLPGNRVLVAEYNGNQVSERDLKGNVVWRYAMVNPFNVQRLPNGNTFMACRNQMLEVDRTGKQVVNHQRPGHDLMAARKLPNGQIAFITANGTYHRMDAAGKVVKSFAVGPVQTFVRMDVLPNGRVVVPQYGASKVVEYDADGKPIWQANVQNPVSAMRLPNGNTLVASLSGQRALELDRQGKEVWTHPTGTQVWRAWRR